MFFVGVILFNAGIKNLFFFSLPYEQYGNRVMVGLNSSWSRKS